MIVTAMLAWYDEPVELLEEAVRSAAVLADRLVAFDGAYALVPDARISSPKEQTEAIRRTARDVGLRHRVVHADRIWKGQVEKRNRMIRLASQDSDWVFPVDADWRIRGEREQIRAELEETECDSICVRFFQPANPERPTAEIAPHPWHALNAGQTEWMALLMRSLPGMRVEQKHWVYSGVKDGARVGFWGGTHYYPAAKMARLQAPHLFEHRCLFRDDKTLARNRVFCELRDQQVAATGTEA